MSDHASHSKHDAHEHPDWKQYKWVALVLFAITIVEVWAYYVPAFVASSAFGSRAQIETSPPAAAKPSAMARPMPRLPPQTTAFLPVKSIFMRDAPPAPS